MAQVAEAYDKLFADINGWTSTIPKCPENPHPKMRSQFPFYKDLKSFPPYVPRDNFHHDFKK